MPASAVKDAQTTRLLRDKVRVVFRHLPGALSGQPEDVHDLRVGARRLRVALPLLAREPEHRRVGRARTLLRDLTRAAGGSRDLDVSLELLEERLAAQPPSPEEVLLRRRLVAARTRARRAMAERLLDLEIAQLRRDLRRVTSGSAAFVFSVLSRLRDARDRRGQAVLEALARLGTRYDPEALHRLRIEMRKLRYTAEVLDAVRELPSGAAPLWKELQDELGRVHDTHVLALWLRGQATRSARAGRAPVAEAAGALHRHFEDESRRLHAELLAREPRARVEQALLAMSTSRSAA